MSNSTTGGHLKKTAKHSAIYAFGTMLRRLTGLVMLPIYTRYLTPADYGVVELLSMAIEIAGILIGLRISQAMFRYYILAESDSEKNIIVSTVLFTIAGSSCLGALVMLYASEPLAQIIFGSTEYIFEFQLFVFTLVTNAIIAVGLSFLRARQNPVLFVAINIGSLILQVSLNIVFVVMLEMHVTGVVYSALISGAVVAAGLTLYVFAKTGFHYSASIAMKLVNFVAPLILASIGAFYVAYADKYFLRLFGSLSDVGLYSLAARVSSILATVYEAFHMSWAADRFEIVKRDDAKKVYEQVFRLLNVIVVLVGAGLALFANDFFRVMTSPEFYPAGYIVPVLVFAAVAQIYTIYCNFGALYRDKTRILAEASWIKAIIASAGYIILIPVLGVYGAAITLAVCGFIEFFWVYRQSSKLYDMGLQWRPVLMIHLFAIMFVGVGLLMPDGSIYYFAARVALYLCLIVAVYLAPVLKDEERILFREQLKKGSMRLSGIYAKK